MVEIYREGNQREQLFNLLGFREKITRTSSSSSSSSSTVIWKPVSNKEELLHTLAEGAAIRSTDCNGINLRSSRSHAVITIRIGYTFEGKTVSAKLMLVDLAGSERAAGAMHGITMTMAGGGAVAVAVTATTPHRTPIAFAGVQSVQATQQQQQQVSPANTPSSPAPSFSTPMSGLATNNANNPLPGTHNNHSNKNTISRIPRTPASAFCSTPMTAPHTSTLQRQGAGINLGLFHLGRLVESLAQGASQQAGMYRNSELTKLLQPALGGGKDSNGGGCNTLMVGCISPLAFHEERTKTTLEFIAKAGTVKNRVSANVVHSEEREMMELKKKVKELEAVNQALVSELAVRTSRPDSSSNSNTIITVPNDDEREMMNQAPEICVCGEDYGIAASTPVPTAENSHSIATEDLADTDDSEKMVHISEEEYRDLINLGRRERDRADGMAALLRHSEHRAEKLEVQVDSLQNQLVNKDKGCTVQCDGIEEGEEAGRERLAITPSKQVRVGEGERGDGTIAAASNRRRRRRESAIGLSAILSLAVTPVVEAADTLRSISVQHDAHSAVKEVENQQQEVEESSTTADLVIAAADISTSISAPSSLANRRRFTADELCMTQYSHLRPDILTVLKSQIERDHLFLTNDVSSNGRRDTEHSMMMRMVSQERENEIAALRLIVATYNEYLGTIEASLTETSDEVIALQSTQQLDLLEAARQKTEYAQRCAAAEAELEDTKDELIIVRKMLAEKEWNDEVTAAAGLSSPSLSLSPMAAGLVSLKNKLSNAVSTGGTGATSLAKNLLKKSVSKISLGGGNNSNASSGVSRLLYGAALPSMPSGGGGGGKRLSSSFISSATACYYSPLGLPVDDAVAASPTEIVADKQNEMLDKENDVVIDLTSPGIGTTTTSTTSTTTTTTTTIHNDAVNADEELQQQKQPPLQQHCTPPTDMIQVIFPPKGKKGLFDPGNQTVLWRDRVYPASEWAGDDDDADAWMNNIKLVHPVTNKKSEISLSQWLARNSSTNCTNNGSSMSSRVKTMCHFCTKNPAKPSAVHPEGLRGIKLCEECYEGLDVGNWKRRDIWWGALNSESDAEGEKEERNIESNVDEGWKYCFVCAGTAPGCTDTLVYCDRPECERGFCTGCLWRFTDDDLAAITAEGYKWQCLKCRDSPVANGGGTNEGHVVIAFSSSSSSSSSSSFVPTRGATNGNVSNKFSGVNITGGDEENVPPTMQQHQGGGGMMMGAAAGGDGKRRRRLIINRVIPASPPEKESDMQQLFGRMEARRGGLSADYAARNPHWKVTSQLQQQQPRRL
jgi:hypothetical protein